MKTKKLHPIFPWIFILINCFFLLSYWCNQAEDDCHYTPPYKKMNLAQLLTKESLTKEDYALIFYQTGLAPAGVDSILSTEKNPVERILKFQENFFSPVQVECEPNTILSKEESVTGEKTTLAPYENADVLITNASHVLFYRNGHAGLMIDAKKGQTLEAAVMGSNSSIQNINKWRSYPNYALLRLKHGNSSLKSDICRTALDTLYDIPYRLTTGIFSSAPTLSTPITGTQCSHLVWCAYLFYDINLDSDGGRIVTPADILNSDCLELVQVYGLDPSEYIGTLSE